MSAHQSLYIILSSLYTFILILAIISNNSSRLRIVPRMDRGRVIANFCSCIYAALLLIISISGVNLSASASSSKRNTYIGLFIVYQAFQTIHQSVQNFVIATHFDSIRFQQNQLNPQIGKTLTQFDAHFFGLNIFYFIGIPVSFCVLANVLQFFVFEDSELKTTTRTTSRVCISNDLANFCVSYIGMIPIMLFNIILSLKAVFYALNSKATNKIYKQKQTQYMFSFSIIYTLVNALRFVFFAKMDASVHKIIFVVLEFVSDILPLVWFQIVQLIVNVRERVKFENED
ncbi:Hypothetical_protein [Hexamita inflata]|uniref:Hypothetical_protein n=1 Tax=Hexamita inflata TaxID=28002 RepID=A0AA86QYN3_9EUKA|nr:Hypothetical protein HINF_LOCUS54680 [Hexamita inflata]